MRPVGNDSYGADVSLLFAAPYSGFGPFGLRRLQRRRGIIDVAFAPAERTLSDDEIVHWLERGADAVETYYGRFPIDRVLVMVLPSEGDEAHGHTLGNGGATMMLMVGAHMDKEATARDWVVTHEMAHLAFPTLPSEQLWTAEGLATYIEPIARAQVGIISVEKVWKDLVDGLPQGEPQAGDRGLDHTHTWGRTYWGGAMFCLLADVEIRERTGNRRGLVDAMRAIVDAGGNLSQPMSLAAALRIGDGATGVAVLMRLRERLGEHAERVDLASLWRRLGVSVDGRQVHFDDAAPLSPICRAITSRAR